MGTIWLSRVYDREPSGRGNAFLIERLRPRGIRRDELAMAGWLKGAAPSAAPAGSGSGRPARSGRDGAAT